MIYRTIDTLTFDWIIHYASNEQEAIAKHLLHFSLPKNYCSELNTEISVEELSYSSLYLDKACQDVYCNCRRKSR